MASGLQGGRTDSEREWVLEFCGFEYPLGDPRRPGAWDIPPKPTGKSRGEGITIIHPDTGYSDHPELIKGGRYLTDNRYAKNFILSEVVPGNPNLRQTARDNLRGMQPGHGTSTASLMNSERGHPNISPVHTPEFPTYTERFENFVSGVAPMAQVIPCRITDSVILNDTNCSGLSRAIAYAISLDPEKVGVISVSLGRYKRLKEEDDIKYESLSHNLRIMLRVARKLGIVVCAAAGQLKMMPNFPRIRVAFPASDPNTICVAGCDYQYGKLLDGFYGPEVDITAPGINIWKADVIPPGDGWGVSKYVVDQGRGTSYATAIVAGACALWQAHHGRKYLIDTYGRDLIFDLFKKVLQDSCYKPQNWDSANRGAGVLDAVALLNHPLPPKSEIERLKSEE